MVVCDVLGISEEQQVYTGWFESFDQLVSSCSRLAPNVALPETFQIPTQLVLQGPPHFLGTRLPLLTLSAGGILLLRRNSPDLSWPKPDRAQKGAVAAAASASSGNADKADHPSRRAAK